jgi:MinD superfamily P-loop ATPase
MSQEYMTLAGANVYEVKATDADVGNPNDVFTFTMEETGTYKKYIIIMIYQKVLCFLFDK